MTIVCRADSSQPSRDAAAIAGSLSCRANQDRVLPHAGILETADPIGFDFVPLHIEMAVALEQKPAGREVAGSMSRGDRSSL